MATMVKAKEVRSLLESKGKDWTLRHFSDALEKRQLRPDSFSIAELAIGCNGQEWFNNLRSQKGGFSTLQEAANVVDTSAFSGITGQIVFNSLLDAYSHPKFLWQDLLSSFQTTFLTGERIPGVGMVGDVFSDPVAEGQAYPTAGVNEEFVDSPALQKRGVIVPVTKEIITADRTGLLLERCQSHGDGLGYNLERRALDLACGVTNNYKRNTISTNTYLTSGAYINQQSNPLVDHTDLENAETLLCAITDPNTGLFMTQEVEALIVPPALKKTAARILNVTEVAVVDNQANAGTHRQWSEAPKTLYDKRFSTVKLLWSPFVKERTSSDTTWFAGSPSKAFSRAYAWEKLTQTAGESSELAFTSDVLMRFKVSVMDAVFVKNPRYMSRNT